MKSPLFWSKDDIWHCNKTKEETKQPPFYEIYCCSGFCQNSHHKGGNVGNILFMPWPAKKKKMQFVVLCKNKCQNVRFSLDSKHFLPSFPSLDFYDF